MDSYAHAAAFLREHDRDRYLADLFAPTPARRHLHALHAFDAEIARIRTIVSEPALGEIRLQWWREVLSGERAEEGAGHPLAAALLATIRDCRLPVAAFDALLSARVFDLYNDPMPTMADFEGWAGETTSAVFQLGAVVLAGGADPGSAEAAGHAGIALALTQALRRLPADAARRQLFLPRDRLEAHGVDLDALFAGKGSPALAAAVGEIQSAAHHHLAEARARMSALKPVVRPAFLPLALAEADLTRLGRPGSDPLKPPRDRPQWRRQWTLWRAARAPGPV